MHIIHDEYMHEHHTDTRTHARPYTHTHTHRSARMHTHTYARALSLFLSLIPALTRTKTHAFVHIFMSACMNAPMCRHKRECVDCIYTHVAELCVSYIHAHTRAHMYIHTLYVCMICIVERGMRMSNAFTNEHTHARGMRMSNAFTNVCTHARCTHGRGHTHT